MFLGLVDEWLRENLDLDSAPAMLPNPDVDGIETFAISSLVRVLPRLATSEFPNLSSPVVAFDYGGSKDWVIWSK